MDTLDISRALSIPLSEIEMTSVRAQGAGGQHVNKVATAIQLRFDIANSPSLSDSMKTRLLETNDQRISSVGVVIIKSQRYRSQDRNRNAALQRLSDLLRKGLHRPKKRIPTRPGKRATQKRLDAKSRHGALKKSRGKIPDD